MTGKVEISEEMRRALRDASIPHGHDKRSLEYYASVGIDYFNHPHEYLAALIDAALEAVAPLIAEAERKRLTEIVKTEMAAASSDPGHDCTYVGRNILAAITRR